MAHDRLVIELPEGLDPESAFYGATEALLDTLGLALAPPEPLGKAVAPHASQFQHRTPGGKFGKAPDPTHLPRLSYAECQEARSIARGLQADELTPRLHRHTADFQAAKIDAAEWYDRFSRDLRYFYGELYRYGKRAAGNPGLLLTPQDKAVLGRLVKDELHYAAGFRDHLAAGGGKMPYPQRTQLYAQAAWEAFWTGFVMGDLRPAREIRWRFGETEEHCEDCARFVEMDWTPAKQFVQDVLSQGFAPRSGMLACSGVHCLCWLEERLLGEDSWVQASPYAEAATQAAPQDILQPATTADVLAVESFGKEAPSALPTSSQADIIPKNGAGEPSGPLSEAPTEGIGPDERLREALRGLQRGRPPGGPKLLYDATAFLFLNAREVEAYANDPERRRTLLALRDRGAKWLAARGNVSEAEARDVLKVAAGLEAYRVRGRFVTWRLETWAEPRLAEYSDLTALYAGVRT